jgi:hypothetical protein
MLLIPGILASRFTPQDYFESIATVTVGAGGAASAEFTSIPGTYQHLQIRAIGQGVTAGGREILFQFNGDTANNYNSHQIYGDGSTAAANAKGSGGNGWFTYWSASGIGAAIMDVLDYTSTNKNKTTRSIGGHDLNGSGFVLFRSGLWFKTPEAITSIKLFADSGNIAQHSHFALYGIKG